MIQINALKFLNAKKLFLQTCYLKYGKSFPFFRMLQKSGFILCEF